jgi:hypothetical protein
MGRSGAVGNKSRTPKLEINDDNLTGEGFAKLEAVGRTLSSSRELTGTAERALLR